MKGYVQLRRGIIDHLKIMSASELKVYIGLLVLSDFKNGTVNITLAKLADTIGSSYKITQLSIHRLEALGYVKFTQAKNQWQDNKIQVIKYKNASVKSAEPTATPTTTAGTTATTTAGTTAKSVNNNKINNLQHAKNYKELLRSYKHLKEEKFVSIFNNYLEMRTSIKKPATEKAIELVLIKLQKHDLETAIKMLENSVVGSWQGVFELKTSQINFQGGGQSLTDEAIEKALGKIATKEMIKNLLKSLPQNLWGRVGGFLRKRYPADGDRSYTEAEREILKEVRQNNDQFATLTQGIGK